MTQQKSASTSITRIVEITLCWVFDCFDISAETAWEEDWSINKL